MLGTIALTAVHPPVPPADITPLEKLLLSLILYASEGDHGTRFFSRYGPSDVVTLPLGELRKALEASSYAVGSVANVYVSERIDKPKSGDPSDPFDDFDLDMTGTSWQFFLQDVVRRSTTIDEIVVTTALVPEGSLFDGLGGSVTVITAEAIKSKSTSDVLEELRTDAFAVSKRAIDMAMELWVAARAMRRDGNELKPLLRSAHRMLDAWEQVGDARMRNWIMAIADDAVAVKEVLAPEFAGHEHQFEQDILPAVLESLCWGLEGPYVDGCQADFLENVRDGIRKRTPAARDIF